MRGQFPLEGAFFSKGSVADQAMPSQAANRSVKFAFRSELGWYAIAYYAKRPRKAFMKEYGRFTVASADNRNNSYVITLYDPDYKGDFKENAPNPSKPNDLSGKKQVATVEFKVHGNELAVTVKNADSNQVSFARGDAFQMTAGPGVGHGGKNNLKSLPATLRCLASPPRWWSSGARIVSAVPLLLKTEN
jgi:hypothetical protein